MKFSFTKKKEGGLSKPSTASVPVVVFMFLLFLMASTVMRETVLNVEQAEGSARGQVAHLKRYQDVAYVYVGVPDQAVGAHYRRGGYTLLLNDSYATSGMIKDFVPMEQYFGAQRGYDKIVFRVKADPALDKKVEQKVAEKLEKAIKEGRPNPGKK